MDTGFASPLLDARETAIMKRRCLMAHAAALLSTTILSGCDRGSSTRNPSPQQINLPPFSPYRLQSKLEELKNAFEEKGHRVSDTLLPPVSGEELRENCDWFPGEIVPELVALYGWHEGQRNGAWEEKHPFWFRDNAFSRLSAAEKEYRGMIADYGVVPGHHKLLEFSFPFAAFNGAWYVLPTKGHPFSKDLTMPVLSVHQGIDVYFYSIEIMIDTCIDWVRHDRYTRSSVFPRELELEIWDKHNPGISKEVL